jgi:hypothetical protein
MFAQVRSAAGIHMSTFKSKTDAEPSVDDDGEPTESGGSLWTPLPSFFAQMQAAEKKAGV